ncbi:hypothetical protein NE237_029362 [Protea cynaroides]|uniref:Uncharacterized protein n=1 Tax=Protea cynaroides TaxID=273540 RepID=A0A9Q0GS55_9MAGN|nr:hypothetical protein NE237_029362 [Protea cynaroides]
MTHSRLCCTAYCEVCGGWGVVQRGLKPWLCCQGEHCYKQSSNLLQEVTICYHINTSSDPIWMEIADETWFYHPLVPYLMLSNVMFESFYRCQSIALWLGMRCLA